MPSRSGGERARTGAHGGGVLRVSSDGDDRRIFLGFEIFDFVILHAGKNELKIILRKEKKQNKKYDLKDSRMKAIANST